MYYNTDRWIPLGNWNGEHAWPVHNDQFSLDIIVALVLLAAIFSFRTNFGAGMILATALLGLWTYFHFQTWWLPYFRGVTSARAIAFHTQFLAHTQVLPRFGNHFPPDAEHTVIDFFLFPAFFFCLVAALRGLFGRSPRSLAT